MTKIIVILGPTGAGKTEIALELAKKFRGEIINADSRQFYRDLVIGTAQPPENFFMEVPHHLFGVSPLDDVWDAARFEKEADQLISAVSGRNHLPLIVGGTGLYLRALLYGLFSGPAAEKLIRNRLEKRIDTEGTRPLYEELKKIDPQAAITIHPNDPVRIIRALEVYEVTGKPISIHQKGHEFRKIKYHCLKLGIQWDRAKLYDRINKRVDRMIENGLEGEVAGLRQKYGNQPILLRSIGYEEWFPYFDGKRSREETIDLIKQNSRNLAKRQLTWFRPEKDIVWFEAGDTSGISKAISGFISDK
ncbi:MAG: tRNA (adenosine(37)-N6)-dimethylallyltransferase MiaA [Deltaproteobacteria bacterium]|nr:tRNA (adenosine(37)-N6)-dimethylallyltransferase MiaA [Deltaproteobacteria bacterium]